jgi:hypothetical protein
MEQNPTKLGQASSIITSAWIPDLRNNFSTLRPKLENMLTIPSIPLYEKQNKPRQD